MKLFKQSKDSNFPCVSFSSFKIYVDCFDNISIYLCIYKALSLPLIHLSLYIYTYIDILSPNSRRILGRLFPSIRLVAFGCCWQRFLQNTANTWQRRGVGAWAEVGAHTTPRACTMPPLQPPSRTLAISDACSSKQKQKYSNFLI